MECSVGALCILVLVDVDMGPGGDCYRRDVGLRLVHVESDDSGGKVDYCVLRNLKPEIRMDLN